MRRSFPHLLMLAAFLLGFATAVGAEDKSAEFYNDRGAEHAEKGQYDQAIADFNKALKINPRLVGAYVNRAVAYEKKGQLDQALADNNKALEINPWHARAYNNRAIAYYVQEEYDKAWKDVRKAQSLGFKVHTGFLRALRQASGREN